MQIFNYEENEIKKFTTRAGHVAYKTTLQETFTWGGLGICDDCGTLHREGGYLVPVLNHWMCEECFTDWQKRAKHYAEDDEYEKQVAARYERILPVEILKEE